MPHNINRGCDYESAESYFEMSVKTRTARESYGTV